MHDDNEDDDDEHLRHRHDVVFLFVLCQVFMTTDRRNRTVRTEHTKSSSSAPLLSDGPRDGLIVRLKHGVSRARKSMRF